MPTEDTSDRLLVVYRDRARFYLSRTPYHVHYNVPESEFNRHLGVWTVRQVQLIRGTRHFINRYINEQFNSHWQAGWFRGAERAMMKKIREREAEIRANTT